MAEQQSPTSLDAFYDALLPDSFDWVNIRSCRERLLAQVITDEEKASMSRILALRCGSGGEMIAYRKAFLTAELMGVDRIPYDPQSSDMYFQLTKADYLQEDTMNTDQILRLFPNPNLIIMRHPGPFNRPRHYHDLWATITTWLTVLDQPIPFVVSFFDFHQDVADQLAADCHYLFPSLSINRYSTPETLPQYSCYDTYNNVSLKPDSHILRVN